MSTDRGRRHLSRWLAAVGAVLILVSVAWILGAPAPASREADPTVPASATAPPEPGKLIEPEARIGRAVGAPREVLIPELGVAAAVLPIKAPGRTLVPPADPQEFGWWADGARPGAERGSALITGHTVHQGEAPMNDLEHLDAGDRVRVRTDRGRLDYQVRTVRTFAKGRLAEHAEGIFAQDGPGRLVLITCEDWDGERYLSNVVVMATPA